MENPTQKYHPDGARRLLTKIGYVANPERISDEELQRITERALSSSELNQRDIEILECRYGLKDNMHCTFKETGRIFGVSGTCIRVLEIKAIQKIIYPEGISKKGKTKGRLRKLIPNLEYDVLYDLLFLARELRVSPKNIRWSINELAEELDLAQIKPYLKSNPKYLLIRIGEQSSDANISSEPFEIPEKDTLHYSQEGYEIAYRQFWKEIESSVQNKGYASSGFRIGFPNSIVYRRAFKEFARDSMLPTAIHQDYRNGFREPKIVYHPKILREARNKTVH